MLQQHTDIITSLDKISWFPKQAPKIGRLVSTSQPVIPRESPREITNDIPAGVYIFAFINKDPTLSKRYLTEASH